MENTYLVTEAMRKVQFTFRISRKKGGRITLGFTIDALRRLQETIYCMFQDKGARAIQLVSSMQ